MSEEMQHDYIKDLIAVAALHATSNEEQQAVEEHVVTCDECRRELDEHRHISTLLGASPALPPESVWEKLSARISEPPPPVRLVREQPPRRFGPHRRFARLMAVAAAVLLVAGGAFGATLLESDENSPAELAQLARDTKGARSTVLKSADGRAMAEAVMLPDGRGYLIGSQMPAAPPDRTYQLWAVVGGTTLSAGVIGNHPDVATFTVSGDITALAITEERGGGVAQSSNPPAAAGSFA